MLSKKQFLQACQGNYFYEENGLGNHGTLYVDFGDERVGIPSLQPFNHWTRHEFHPFENAYHFDAMPIEKAMEDEVLDRLYEEYVAQKESGCLWLQDLEKDF